MENNKNQKTYKLVPACTTCKGNCWGCFYADECPNWNDTGHEPAYIQVEVEPEYKLNVALCKGRHEIPQATDGAIFPMEIGDVTNVGGLEDTAFFNTCSILQDKGIRVDMPDFDGTNMPSIINNVHINLYVTGLTVALIAFLNTMCNQDVTITLWHYNRETNDYYPQEVRR